MMAFGPGETGLAIPTTPRGVNPLETKTLSTTTWYPNFHSKTTLIFRSGDHSESISSHKPLDPRWPESVPDAGASVGPRGASGGSCAQELSTKNR